MENLTQINQPKTLNEFEESQQKMISDIRKVIEKLKEKGKTETAEKFQRIMDAMLSFTEDESDFIEQTFKEIDEEDESIPAYGETESGL